MQFLAEPPRTRSGSASANARPTFHTTFASPYCTRTVPDGARDGVSWLDALHLILPTVQ